MKLTMKKVKLKGNLSGPEPYFALCIGNLIFRLSDNQYGRLLAEELGSADAPQDDPQVEKFFDRIVSQFNDMAKPCRNQGEKPMTHERSLTLPQ